MTRAAHPGPVRQAVLAARREDLPGVTGQEEDTLAEVQRDLCLQGDELFMYERFCTSGFQGLYQYNYK